MPNRPPGSCGQLLSIRRSVAPNELSHRPYSHSNPHASRLPFVSSCRQTPSLDPPSNEVVGIPCAPFALGLLVTGLLAGGITTSPLTSTYPWVRSEPMSTNPARSLRKVSHGDLLSPPFCARSSVSLRSGGSILQSKAGPFLASCEGHFIESAEELYSTAAHSTSWAKLPKGRSFSANVYLRAPT